MTAMQDDARTPASDIMYIRGVPFQCPAGPESARSEAGPDVARDSCRDGGGVCPSSLLARFAASDSARAGVSRAESLAQTEFMKNRRMVRVFAEKAVPMRLLRDLIGVASGSDADRLAGLARFIMVEAAPAMGRITGMAAAWLRGEGLLADRAGPDADARKVVFGNAPHMAIVYGPGGGAGAASACALAAARLEWAAMASGLGACFAGELVRAASGSPELATALAVPAGHVVMAAVLLGYPAFPAEDGEGVRQNRIIWL